MDRSNKTKFAVLGMLSFRPMSGYDINKLFEKHCKTFWGESYGQIYSVLKKLDAEKSVTSSEKQQDGRPTKSIYKITAAGKKKLKEYLVKPADKFIVRNEGLLKLSMGHNVGPEDNLKHIERLEAQDKQILEFFEMQREEGARTGERNMDTLYRSMVIDLSLELTKTKLKWYKTAKKTINDLID